MILQVFSSENCAPCRMLDGVLHSLSTDEQWRLPIVKVDALSDTAASAQARVSAVPTLILKDGERELARRTGFVTAGALQEWVAASS